MKDHKAGEFLQVADLKNVQRWTDAIAKRPAVRRGRMVNHIVGDPASPLRERHEASDVPHQDAGLGLPINIKVGRA